MALVLNIRYQWYTLSSVLFLRCLFLIVLMFYFNMSRAYSTVFANIIITIGVLSFRIRTLAPSKLFFSIELQSAEQDKQSLKMKWQMKLENYVNTGEVSSDKGPTRYGPTVSCSLQSVMCSSHLKLLNKTIGLHAFLVFTTFLWKI